VEACVESKVYESEIVQIVTDVFSTMLAMEIWVTTDRPQPSASRVTAVIFFAGEWKGAVLVECTPDQAVHITRGLMPKLPPDCLPSPPAPMTGDVRDALGELANMIGGNLKSVLPRGVGLSMPSVVEGSDYAMRILGGNLVTRIGFSSEMGPFVVTLVEMIQ